MKEIIPVTKPYLPSREKLNKYIDGIYERNWLTNNGPLVQELTKRLEEYLGVENLLLISNGTLALQIAYRALGINEPANGKPAEAITTPFTFVATSSSLKWEGVNPVFVDIDKDTWNLDPELIEEAITPQTRAIVPVHVFGNPCDVEAIHEIAERHQLKVIYDAAHAFGVNYRNESVLKWGDAATLSFHATKVFHTIEGGAIVFKHKKDLEKAKALINFGITGPDQISELGINAKMSEFNAAMGLCVLDDIIHVFQDRKERYERYMGRLSSRLERQCLNEHSSLNYSYIPILLDEENVLKDTLEVFSDNDIYPRRYFYPSLNNIDISSSCLTLPISESVSSRVLCLPIYSTLKAEDIDGISNIVNSVGGRL
ncbi:DegT/DnrJ/EryC1/StrS family aminotransferase [Salinispirillum sp. LH 10-3-1]|uniref:DegT/DnrJ/EryC1/StrS family aminotransferase n=1 Tax=Salinispirillum sp. LH 10-3-1 TaxID=2952525 RepID=A0AB38YJK6_9GAMM